MQVKNQQHLDISELILLKLYNQKMKLQGDAYSGLNSFLSPYLQKSLNSMSMPTL